MRARRIVLVAGLVLLVLIGGWVVHAVQAPAHRITIETYDKVRLGMSRAEVEDLFGVPPGLYNRYDVWILRRASWDKRPRHAAPIPAGSDVREWKGDALLVHVAFDAGGAVVGFDSWDLLRADDPFFHRVRRWLWLD